MKLQLPLILCLAWVTVAGRAAELTPREWTIDGVKREALIYAPSSATTTPAPLVFVFHGHGGNMRGSARSMPFHQVWPEAIVVFPQGLKTPGRLTDPEGKLPGWQQAATDQDGRDLKFFDAMLRSVQADYKVDAKRIYSTGHSNGGAFTYLLWSARGDVFAAFGPSAALLPPRNGTVGPHAAIHVAGENDPLVKFEWQKQMMDDVRRTNQCGEGQSVGKGLTLYPSKIGAPFMTYIHPGTHAYPKEAPAIIAEFFKTHAKE